jgi:hypothetical protein
MSGQGAPTSAASALSSRTDSGPGADAGVAEAADPQLQEAAVERQASVVASRATPGVGPVSLVDTPRPSGDMPLMQIALQSASAQLTGAALAAPPPNDATASVTASAGTPSTPDSPQSSANKAARASRGDEQSALSYGSAAGSDEGSSEDSARVATTPLRELAAAQNVFGVQRLALQSMRCLVDLKPGAAVLRATRAKVHQIFLPLEAALGPAPAPWALPTRGVAGEPAASTRDGAVGERSVADTVAKGTQPAPEPTEHETSHPARVSQPQSSFDATAGQADDGAPGSAAGAERARGLLVVEAQLCGARDELAEVLRGFAEREAALAAEAGRLRAAAAEAQTAGGEQGADIAGADGRVVSSGAAGAAGALAAQPPAVRRPSVREASPAAALLWQVRSCFADLFCFVRRLLKLADRRESEAPAHGISQRRRLVV